MQTLTERQAGSERLSVLCLDPDISHLYPFLCSAVWIESDAVLREDRLFADELVGGL